ncbi:uncharacterized protein N0V89_011325 [Didymosphaeria variabile]|uniref:Uncharacterized protein n=1 Tax=Didymosphaeria variabile TaxID=1932322 RepID=A0A9W9C4N2_9PLEO|nr:uncharacterized protein N0V89_011325 [Didymosphaeria variabile]KAJ4345196.1 hypothetical protein N0V89_011325 [Didymosphaeria variabile]
MAKMKNKKPSRAAEGDEAIEKVAPTANPEPSTAEPEATAIPKPQAEPNPLSPYASSPVTINVGPVPVTYYVPWHLLKSTNWSTIPPGGEISLPTISADTGHILVHYLYTGAYQTLKSKIGDIAQQPQLALKQALLVYRVSVTHTLDRLEQLARQQIEEHSASMDLKTMLDIIRSELPKKTEPSDWLQAYLKDKTQKAFEKDHTVFADDAFCASLCKKSKLNDYVVRHVVKLLSEKLTQALAGKGNIADEVDESPRALLVSEEIVAGTDPFAGLSKGQRKRLEKKMREEKEQARLVEEEVEAAALAQYGYVDDDPPLAPDVGEEPDPVEELETCWEALAPASERDTYYEVSIPAPEPEPGYEDAMPAPEPEPCYEDCIDVVGSETLAPEPPRSVWVEYVPPPRPKKETATSKKKRLAKEKKDKEKWDKKQQERIDREEKEAPCEEPVPTSDAYSGDSAPHAQSDSSREHAVPVPVDEAEPIYDHSIPVEPEPLYEVPPPELISVSDYPREPVPI